MECKSNTRLKLRLKRFKSIYHTYLMILYSDALNQTFSFNIPILKILMKMTVKRIR